jgi:hypothetical protein
MVAVVVGGVGKDAIVAAAINCRHSRRRRAVGSIPLPPQLTTTAIAAVDNRHRRCHTVNNDDRQKPAVVVRRRRQQWQSLSTEAAVGGGRGDGGLRQWRSSSTEAAVGWRDDDAMASAKMASSADDSGSNGGHRRQLCSGGWCRRHHPIIGVDGGGKDAIMPSSPLPLTVASINNDCYRCCRRPPLPLPHSRRWTAAVVFVDGNSNGKGRRGQGRTRAQGQGHRGGGKGGEGGKGEGVGERLKSTREKKGRNKSPCCVSWGDETRAVSHETPRDASTGFLAGKKYLFFASDGTFERSVSMINH